MKNGFTLIELLAVIIILAILMVIAVPNILRTLNESKEKMEQQNIISYAKIIEKEVVRYNM